MLAASGVLEGRKAGGHWLSRALLAKFGVIPSDARMTIDGKFYTSGGVTSGIDMALRVVADLVDEATARKIQLQIEYDPAPPFVGGTPITSPPEITAALRGLLATAVPSGSASLPRLLTVFGTILDRQWQ